MIHRLRRRDPDSRGQDSMARRPRKDGVLVIECRKKGDPGSEGRFLRHMFDLMQHVEYELVRASTKDQLLEHLAQCRYAIAHISTHGAWRKVNGTKKFSGWWTPTGKVRAN